jgi:hypothetical protein
MKKKLIIGGALFAAFAIGAVAGQGGQAPAKTKMVVQTKTVQAPPKVITKWKIHAVAGPTKTVTVPGPTKTVTVHVSTPPPAPSGHTFHGVDNENIGTIHVAQDSTLTWTNPGGSSSNFIINNDFNDDNLIDVNSLNHSSGKTAISAGDYTKVDVVASGAWSFTITPGNSTQN